MRYYLDDAFRPEYLGMGGRCAQHGILYQYDAGMVFCHGTGKAAGCRYHTFRFTAIGIDDAHADVGLIARYDDDDAIGADACMGSAHLDGQLGKILVRAVLSSKKTKSLPKPCILRIS